MVGSIDLSRLPFPKVIEEIDFEAIYEQKKAALKAAMLAEGLEEPSFLESDPAMQVLRVAAYDEMILRQDMNDKARDLLLAFSQGTGLDHLGAGVNVERQEVSPAQLDVYPPVDAVLESDDALRRRIQLAPQAITTAGSTGSYIFHGLSAGATPLSMDVTSPQAGAVVITYKFSEDSLAARVKDVYPLSPAPCEVDVYVLSRLGSGLADATILADVARHLNTEAVRPLSELIRVKSASIREFSVLATLDIEDGPSRDLVIAEARENALSYVEAQHRLGGAVTESGLDAACHIAGVRNVQIAQSGGAVWQDVLCDKHEAPFCTDLVVV